VRKVRRDGSYIYEEFMPTGGTDVKVAITYYFIFFFVYRSALSYCYPKNNEVLTMEPNLHVIGLYSWAWICTC
jgi:hypothetical protein